jgi:hypothetical protein
MPSRYTGVFDCGQLYAPGAKLKLPPLSVIVEARMVPVDPYPDVPIAITEIVAPTTGCCPPIVRPATAGDTIFGSTLDI